MYIFTKRFLYSSFKSFPVTKMTARLRSLLPCAGIRKPDTTQAITIHGDKDKQTLILDKLSTLSEGEFTEFILKHYTHSELDRPFIFAYESACCCDVRVLLDLELGKIDKCLNRLASLVSAGQCQHVADLQQSRSPFMAGLTIERVNDYKWKLAGAYGAFKVVYKAHACSSIRLVHLACAQGKLELVNTLKELNCNFGTENEKDLSPFDMAIIYGHVDIFNFLISDEGTEISDRALEKAAGHGRTGMLSELLKRNSFSKSCLSIALSSAVRSCGGKFNTDIVEILLREGAIPNKEAMDNAISAQDLSTVEFFLTSGAEIDPWHIASAVRMDNLDMVRLLISFGWAEKLNMHLNTPLLIWAVFNNHVTIVKTLIGQNADINVNHYGYTALDWALTLGWAECIQCLESVGAKSNPEITLHSPPLFEMWNVKPITARVTNVIDRLVCRGCDVNVCRTIKDYFGNLFQTPLGLAVSKYDIPSIRCLLKHGADPFYCSRGDGSTSPLYTAIYRGDDAVVKEMVLCNVAAFPNSVQKNIFFDKVCESGYSHMHQYVDLLLKCGWTINRKDLSDRHDICENDELKAIFKQHMCKKHSLSALCENAVREFCAFDIHEFLRNQLLPISVKYDLSLKEKVQEFERRI